VEFHGTYPLPEAQLDRFALRIDLGYPAREQEIGVLFAQLHHHPLEDVTALTAAQDVLELQTAVRAVRIERPLAGYLVDLAQATRVHAQLRLGCSPRGTLALLRMTQARAALSGRDYAVPEDVKAVAVATLAHRLMLDTKARYAGRSKEDVVHELLAQVPVGL
jgi:MoxR-like ATPase